MALVLTFTGAVVRGDQFGDFTYTDNGTDITITDYPTTAVGAVSIPSTIIGKPVTTIGYSAFNGCSGLTSVTIPASVTSIDRWAFRYCRGLTSVTIPSNVSTIGAAAFEYCNSMTSVTIPAGVTSIGDYAFRDCSSMTSVSIPAAVTSIKGWTFYGCWNLSSVSLPEGLISIGEKAFAECWNIVDLKIPKSTKEIGKGAFSDCSGLAYVTIPANVMTLPTHAFQFCTSLEKVVFQGDAPMMGANVFYGAKPSLTLNYYDGSAGFSSPIWYGFPSVNLGAWDPVVAWLESNGFPVGTDILSDPNKDGVSLLMAYALDLDPQLNLSGAMPKPVLSGGTLSISFFAGSEGVNYAVETSETLRNWTTDGVTIGSPDQNQRSTATVPAPGPSRFIRLVVSR